MNKVWNIIRIIAGFYCAFIGVAGINKATTWLAFTIGLFWVFTGSLSLYIGWNNIRGSR